MILFHSMGDGPPKVSLENSDRSPESFDASSFQRKLEKLLHSGIPLEEIAQIFGAEKYMTQEQLRGHGFKQLKITDFVQDQSRLGVPVRLPDDLVITGKTILPPGEGQIAQGSGNGIEDRKMIPRTNALISVLSQLKEPYSLVLGKNAEGMMRKE